VFMWKRVIYISEKDGPFVGSPDCC